MSHSHFNIADNFASRRIIALSLREKAIKEAARKKAEEAAISECRQQISGIINELQQSEVIRPHLPVDVSGYLSIFTTQEIIEKELIEWQKLQVLIQLKKKVEQDPYDTHSLSLLTLYTADTLLTIDASLSQEKMQRRAIILGVLAAIILAAFPITFSMLAFTHGSLLGVGIELGNVLCSKIEGIFGFFTGMKTSDGACRQSFSHLNRVQANLEKRKDLSSHQKCFLALKQSPVKVQEEKKNNADEILVSTQDLLSRADQTLRFQEITDAITNDFDAITVEAKKLIHEPNVGTPQDQADWIELLPYLIRFSEDHLNINVINELDQKAKEIWVRAEARQKQEIARKIAKVMLLASLALTIVCVATILIAMAFYGAVATSGLVVIAHALIYLSKAMFWLSSIPAAGGSIDAKHYQKNTDKPIDVRPEKINKLTSLQKISFYSEKITQTAKGQAQQSHEKNVSMERTPSLLPSAA